MLITKGSDDINQAPEKREDYLKSFNRVNFVDDCTIIIDQKYLIKKSDTSRSALFSISNMNDYWKTDISFLLHFDHADLEKISDDAKYQVRFLEFTLWGQEQLIGSLKIKFGYEDEAHEGSVRLAEFFNCNDLDLNKIR